MRLKLDENLAGRGRELLAAGGHEVVTVVEEGLCAAEDRALYAACQAEQRGLVTLGLDFANPFIHPPETTAGIMVLRLPDEPAYADLLAALRMLLAVLAVNDPRGRLWVVDARQVRVYRPETED
ncbi:MAG: DUF5615 family PIN-like protein [Verrucomicrobiota bacterium]|jgi:predicted nuclease of predicted toxin-antitoxin system